MKNILIALGITYAISGMMLEAKKETYCTKAERCPKGEKLVSCCNPTLISAESLNSENVYFIPVPGAYALTEDIQGRIVIGSSDVCLDLKRHTISYDTDSVIVINSGLSNVQIKNGTVRAQDNKNAIGGQDSNGLFFEDLVVITQNGGVGISLINSFNICVKHSAFTNNNAGNCIEMLNSSGITFKSLSFENPTGRGISFQTCKDFSLQDLQFFPVDQAIRLEGCVAGSICEVNASKNTTKGHMISMALSQDISFNSIDVSYCKIDRPASGGLKELILLQSSQDISLICSTINNNECVDLGYFITISFYNCSRVKIQNIQANFNKGTNSAPSVSGFDNIYINGGNTYCIKDCQFNNTYVATSSYYLNCVDIVNVKNLLIDSCQIKETTIGTYVLNTGSAQGSLALYIADCSLVTIRKTRINDTAIHLIDKNATGSANFINSAVGVFLANITRCLVEDCEVNGTTIKSVSPALGTTNNIASGFYIENLKDLEVCNTEACRSVSAGDQAYGFDLYGSTGNNGPLLFKNCKANCNSATSLAAGFATHLAGNRDIDNLTIDNSCANDNTAILGYGFALEGSDFNLISHSYASGNTTSGFYLGRLLSNQTGVNEITKLIRNCAEENGIGFLFATDINLPTYSINTLLMLENIALNNTNCGFERRGTNFSNETWVGNAAQGNKTDFCIDPIAFKEKKGVHLTCDLNKGLQEGNISFGGTRS